MGTRFFYFIFIENNEVVTDSKKVAEVFGKRHNDLMKRIRELNNELGGVGEKSHTYFTSSFYENEQNNQVYEKYLLTRDGFTLLVMGFTGKKALQFKMMYINEFNRMEQELKKHLLLTLGYVKHT
ncbi:hypothetical protein BKK41_16065 [Bacillus cereus]|nr:hypothetical protein BKK41_16065 [Bacillus cereus]